MAYTDAVGRAISADSIARITAGWGVQVAAQRTDQAQQANRPAQRDEEPTSSRVPEIAPIGGQANLSTDGAMALIRGEGWKEVKITALSAVTVTEGQERTAKRGRPSRRDGDPLVHLTAHSYQAGLWDAETLGQYQYAEGLRRGMERCDPVSAVADAAVWIERVTRTNFPQAIQIVDWSHADERLWAVGKAVFGEGSTRARQWTEARLDDLWDGKVAEVVRVLETLDLAQERYPAEVQQAAGYFRNNQERMRYDVYRSAGYPIGSGTVESAANTVVHHRLKRPGRGWERHNAQAMLAGLSELHSDRFDRAWQDTLPSVA